MSNSNPLISGTAMGVVVGVVLVIGPWAISWPDSVLWRVVITIIGGVLVWVSLNKSKG